MEPTHIADMERLLDSIRHASGEQLQEFVTNFLECLCLLAGLQPTGQNSDPTFSSLQDLVLNTGNTPQQKRVVAGSLLRLLCSNENAIWSFMPFRVKVFILFDEQLIANKVYNILKINTHDETHTKVSKLRGIEHALLADFSDMTVTITSVKNAIDIRTRFMKAIHNPVNRIILEPFVCHTVLSDERVKELFDMLVEYNESSTLYRLSVYNQIEKLFNSFITCANSFPSVFSQQCIIDPMSKISSILHTDILNTDAIKQADISIEPKNNKYPLLVPDRHIDVKLAVKNHGPGHAFKTYVEVHSAEGISVTNSRIFLGDLEAGETEIIFKAKTLELQTQMQNFSITGEANWENFDSSKMKVDFQVGLIPQRSDLDWDKLSLRKPYSLEAVETEHELVGRSEIIKALSAKIFAERIESSIIYGQKRVGKTSIARTIQSSLLNRSDYTPLFIKMGDLDKNTPYKLVNNLASEILTELSAIPTFNKAERPVFDGALAPLIRYFKNLKHIAPKHKFVLIIDEFDEIPADLYHYTQIGDTFFHNIRSLSDESHIGLILVGGENMHLIKQSTDRLNKFDTFKVDYFDRERFWNDFRDLVSKPVSGTIDYSEEAIIALYSTTEGNPFYTKLICGKAFSKACDTRDAFISYEKANEAIRESITSLDVNHVNHFWKDNITVDQPTIRDDIETQRRKFLIAFADIKRRDGNVSKLSLEKSKILENQVAVGEMIESFRVRGILVEDQGYFRLKPKFFEQWLIEFGSQIITTGFLDKKALDVVKDRENLAYVKDSEIIEVSSKWGLYRGMKISSADIRCWLDQFDKNIEKRLMFSLLRKVRLYDELIMREKVRAIHNLVKSDLVHEIKGLERVRHDFLLSSFGKPSKSGSSLTRIYATENRISHQNIAAFERIASSLETNDRIKAVVLIDDIIGSGETILDLLNEVNKSFSSVLIKKGIKLVVAAICGLSDGIEFLESRSKNFKFALEIRVCDLLTNADKCFSDLSDVYESAGDRIEAERVALKYGKRIEKDLPLGFENGQLLVVFRDNCPDNSLPILWGTSKGIHRWTPLFRRN